MEPLTGELTAQTILKYSNENHASDIHVTPMSPLMVRVDGDLVAVSDHILNPQETHDIIRPMMDDQQWAELEEKGELDFAYSFPGFSRVRVNAFRQRGTYGMAMRILSFVIPSPQQLGIPRSVVDLTNRKRGLVLVTGATGSGKSTTLASLINVISENYAKHIITLEDPIEYLHKHKKSIVAQREVGTDTQSYANALRAALRQDPDVILVGEMRDLETISIAITAAETGHLVFSTLHTNSTSDAINRVIDVFPPHQQQQIRIQLASVLEGVIAQQLLPRTDGGRVAAFEVLLANSAVRNLIREGKAFQIPSMIQTGKKEGMQTMDDNIYELLMANFITKESAIQFALDQGAMIEKTAIFT
ncbi:MAG: type IV pilus twitching motility protein PilT [Lachnospiraceae bacterium]|nr:type IV pilus twitching motility protein PilT [Lachnospiraceae bacterium]MDY3274998.1 type IV pilus twitching motility protein PilT [Agathobacter sp.]MDY5521811.1 type IV pilus twitching motility protein PilT [Agathobacter sp.]